MALTTTITTPNGAVCSYHRIDTLELDMQSKSCNVEVGSYIDEKHAYTSRTPKWTYKYTMFVQDTTTDVRSQLYAQLNKLEPFTRSANV